MKKKTTWAASVVKKQLQTCCKHQTFSLEAVERDDSSEGFESPSFAFHISSPIKEAGVPSLLRRRSYNVFQSRSLLTTPEPQTPFRKSVESALPLCEASTFKPVRIQNVKSSPDLATTVPLPSSLEAPKYKILHKSGPLPVLQQFFKGGVQGSNLSSPLTVKKQLSGPLPSLPRGPLSDAQSPRQSVGGPSPQRLAKVKFNLATPATIAHSKRSDLISEEEAPKLPTVVEVKSKKQSTPVLDRKGSRGSRLSKSQCSPAPSPELKLRTESAVDITTDAVGNDFECQGEEEISLAQCAFPATIHEYIKVSNAEKDLMDRKQSAVVKIQAALRGYQTRKRFVNELQIGPDLSRVPTEEPEESQTISTQMSRIDPQKTRSALPRQASKGWNGSIRTSQDYQALLRSKQEAAVKRERAMEYALSRQRWRAGSRSVKGPVWCTDDRFPDKPGWVWNWLERATRISAHNSENKVLDNDFDRNDPQSESLSMKSTVGMCTNDIGSVDMDLGWPMTKWPLSLRQQHVAGLLPSKTAVLEPSGLQKAAPSVTPQLKNPAQHIESVGTRVLERKRQRDERHNLFKREDVSTCTADSRIASLTSGESLPRKPRYGNRNLRSVHQNNGLAVDLESTGSCESPVPAFNRLPTPYVGIKRPQLAVEYRLSNPDPKEPKHDQLHGDGQKLARIAQRHVSVAISDGDSAGTTAASVRRPFWRP